MDAHTFHHTIANQADFYGDCEKIRKILDNCTVEVTFWGSRVLRSGSFSDSEELDFVARKVFQSIPATYTAESLTTDGRYNRVQMLNKVQSFYQKSDELIEKGNIITRIICWIRELPLFSNSPREAFLDGGDKDAWEKRMLTYSIEDYRKNVYSVQEVKDKYHLADPNQATPNAEIEVVWDVLDALYHATRGSR